MFHKNRILSLLLGLVLLLGVGLPGSATAAILGDSRAAPAQQAVTITNGGFEQFEPNGVATGWASWVVQGSPTYRQITSATDARRVQAGSSAQMMTTSAANFQAGLQQTVFGLTPGQRYRFTIYAHAWATDGTDPNVSEYTEINLRIGIGQGETYAADPSITWSSFQNYVNNYQQLAVEVTATGSVITLFTYANPAVHAQINDVYWDSAALTQVGASPTQAPGATQPPPAPTLGIAPTPFLTPTPNASGQNVYTVQPGDTLVRIATIACGETPECVEQIKALNGLTSNIISVGQQLIIGPLTGGPAAPAPTAAPAQPTADTSVVQPTADPGTGGENGAGGELVTPEAPEEEPTALPLPTITPVALGEGSICVTLYNDANGNGILDAGELLVSGGTFTLRNQQAQEIGRYITTGLNEPYCFQSLSSGTYQISSVVPTDYVATTRTDWDLTLAAGSAANVEFGAQYIGTGNPDAPSTGGGGGGGLLTAILAAGGAVLLLVAAGVALFIVLNRRAG